jgi:hypothetical protein
MDTYWLTQCQVLDNKVDQVNINVGRCLRYLESDVRRIKCCITFSFFLSCILIKFLLIGPTFMNIFTILFIGFNPLWFFVFFFLLVCLPFVLLKQKRGVIFIFWFKSFLSQNGQRGSLLVYFNWLILS